MYRGMPIKAAVETQVSVIEEIPPRQVQRRGATGDMGTHDQCNRVPTSQTAARPRKSLAITLTGMLLAEPVLDPQRCKWNK